jgi:uncharacterized protein (DUF362 family)
MNDRAGNSKSGTGRWGNPPTFYRIEKYQRQGMSILDNIQFQFDESMSGHFCEGETDPRIGEETGKKQGNAIRFDVHVVIKDLGGFLKLSGHSGELTGAVSFKPLGENLPIRNGTFSLFSHDEKTGMRLMVYAFAFTGADGEAYYLHGHKELYHDKRKLDLLEDITSLFTVIHKGEDTHAPVYGAGVLHFLLKDTVALVTSMKAVGDTTVWQRIAARTAFFSFGFGELREEYFKNINPFYNTEYENLVLSGFVACEKNNASLPFFFVSGVHDKGFPWGDNETFWDVMLVIANGNGGWERYCISDRVLDGLAIDVEHGSYRYSGPIFTLADGHAASFIQMRKGDGHLIPCEAEIELKFEARAFDNVSFPFSLAGNLVRRLTSSLSQKLHELLPSHHSLGVNIMPHSVTTASGTFAISRSGIKQAFSIDREKTSGEAERTTFCNIKEPTLLYNYLCALRPGIKAARVQIHTSTLRDEREHWAKDRLDAFLGTVISRMASKEFLIEQGRLSEKKLGRQGEEYEKGNLLKKLGPPLLEIRNDHYPTAVFVRSIVQVQDPSGCQCLALEESMRLMRLEPVNSNKKAIVASIKNDDKFAALDVVLAETRFDALIEARRAATKKSKKDFSIIIKPNFMFSYDKNDLSTFTDPQLVGQLAKRLAAAGYESIKVVEAHSTYGEYFDKRSVREMADYLGYDEKDGYRVIDMTEEATEMRDFGGALGVHPVSPTWRDADFRISFAKNKTHAYAYYTLTLKNIYGALALGNKFKEYHCGRGIYKPAIQYLGEYPVHFGLIDAYLSADGPFGVFSDTLPNQTHTIIGGEDLVAVDWVGASKMGIDPMISEYMRLAVEKSGKPEITLVGDDSLYLPWLNVPVALQLFTNKGLDANYHFGNLFYTAASQMDQTHFTHKSRNVFIKLLRACTNPIRQTFFLRTGENPTVFNRLASWVLWKMGY